MKEYLLSLDTLNINLGSNEMVLVNFILAFVMFGVALSIRTSTLKSIFKKPTAVIIGLILQWVALPALTCLVAIALNPIITPMVAIGMILVASCPGGNISNFLSSYSKGNIELSVSLTAITTLFASIVTPLNFWFWGAHYFRFAEIRNDVPTLEIPFTDVLLQIILILGFPIVMGMVVSHFFPRIAKKITKITQVLSILFFIGMVIVSMTQVLSGFEQRWEVYAAILCGLIVVVIHNAIALGTGFFGGKAAGLPNKDCKTLSIEVGIQNSGLALALLFNPTIFSPDVWGSNGGMVIVAALWGIWHIISGLTISTIYRHRANKKQA
ncbi:MAG: bile acid:sodium symporter family protein [Bacteroidaceae bacterium]|nr:bile acid:sodium symporter family protein [Bacteroidaceae bacterium]